MLILKRERHLIAQRPAEPTSQIAMLQLLQLTQHRAIALPWDWRRFFVFSTIVTSTVSWRLLSVREPTLTYLVTLLRHSLRLIDGSCRLV